LLLVIFCFFFVAKSFVRTPQSCPANRCDRIVRRVEWKRRLRHVICLFWQFGGTRYFTCWSVFLWISIFHTRLFLKVVIISRLF